MERIDNKTIHRKRFEDNGYLLELISKSVIDDNDFNGMSERDLLS